MTDRFESRREVAEMGECARQAGPALIIRRTSMRKTFLGMLVVGAICFVQAPRTLAQAASTQKAPAASSDSSVMSDQDIKMFREDIRSKKKQLIAANLTLTDVEATKFWPVYDQYTAELVAVNNTKYAALKEYADRWGSLTDDQAISLINRSLDVDKSVAQLRIKYVPIFQKVIPGTKVATFFQIDRRLQMIIDAQLASHLPMVQDQN
jgi:hypothetical protein